MKDKLVPLDLWQLWEKLVQAKRDLETYTNIDRSEEFRAISLKSCNDKIDVCIRDIEYLIDTKDINGYKLVKSVK